MRSCVHSLAVVDRVDGRDCVVTTRVGIDSRLWNGPIALAFVVNDWGGATDSNVEERLRDRLVELLERERVWLAAG